MPICSSKKIREMKVEIVGNLQEIVSIAHFAKKIVKSKVPKLILHILPKYS